MRAGAVKHHPFKYYEPVSPQLVRTTPDQPIRLGVHCLGFDYFAMIRTCRLPVNLIEVKPDKFKGDDALFGRDGDEYRLNQKNFERLVAEARRLGLEIQFHFPEALAGINLNGGLAESHPATISLFQVIAGAVLTYGLLPTVTFHPSTLYWGDRRMIPNDPESIASALLTANDLLHKLTAEHAKQGWPLVLGLENQAGPTETTHSLGYRLEHFEALLAGTPDWINLTLDAGHRLLHPKMRFQTQLLPLAAKLGKRVVNIHFHENPGTGDKHQLPHGEYILGYLNYLRRAIHDRIPVIFEVNIDRFNPHNFLSTMMGVKALLEQMEAERLEDEAN